MASQRVGAGEGNRTLDIQLGKLDVSQQYPADSCKTGRKPPYRFQWVTTGLQNRVWTWANEHEQTTQVEARGPRPRSFEVTGQVESDRRLNVRRLEQHSRQPDNRSCCWPRRRIVVNFTARIVAASPIRVSRSLTGDAVDVCRLRQGLFPPLANTVMTSQCDTDAL